MPWLVGVALAVLVLLLVFVAALAFGNGASRHVGSSPWSGR